MKKSFLYTSVASAILLAMNTAYAAEKTEELEAIDVVGSVAKAGKVDYMDPKSVAVLNAEQIAEKNYQQADEIGRYQAGMLSQPYGADLDTNDWIRVRGFEPTIRIDGTQMYNFGFYHWQPNMYGLESVEIVKGADSLTFGTANSGGIINLISKRPTKDPKGEIKFTLGNRNERGISADYSNSISDNLRFRLVGDYQRRDGEPKGSYLNSYYFAPSLAWDITQNTNLTLLASIQHDDGVPSSGFFPAYDVLKDSGLTSRTNFAENVDEYMRRNQSTIGYEFTHKFGDGWTYKSNYRYAYSNKDQFSASLWGNALSTMHIKGKTFTHTLDNRISKEFKFDRIENILTVGFDYNHSRNPAESGYGSSDILTSLYGSYPTAVMPITAPALNKERQLGIYVQNQFRFDNKLIVNLGARRDYAKGEYADQWGQQEYDVHHNTLSGGIMYVTDIGLSPYYNYTESFKPISGTRVNGRFYDYKPYEGTQHEFGFKYLPSFIDGQISVAYFDLKEKNALMSDPNSPLVQIQSGEKTSKGVELQADLNITDNLSTLLAYTYNKSETFNGKSARTAIIPKHSYSAFFNYRIQGTPFNGLKLGAGMRYIGTSTNGVTDSKIPAYTLVDLMAQYPLNKNWVAQVNVSNLANKKYVSACDATWCYMGEGRRITANLSYKW